MTENVRTAAAAYLGDGVYVDLDFPSGGVVLTTEDGVAVTNRIVLEPDVLHALEMWIARQRARSLVSPERSE